MIAERLGSSTRRGAILVKFALLSFAFFAIAALVIDMRIASWTQQLMQNASDSTALEALRRRDQDGPIVARDWAKIQMSFTFDDDLDPWVGGDAFDYGAGPATRVANMTADGLAGFVDIPAARVYEPDLAMNRNNVQHGDFVAGDFDYTDLAHQEFADYSRTDFTPAAVSDLATADSMLVRIRRTPGTNGLDDQSQVSTRGDAIPLLWGRGSLVKNTQGSGYDVRLQGITVRSTSISSARRALEITTPVPTPPSTNGYTYTPLQRFSIRSDPSAGPLIAPGQVVSTLTPGAGGALPPGHGGIPPGQLAPPPGQNLGPPGFWEHLPVGGSADLTARADGTIRYDNFTFGGPPATYRGGLWGYFARVNSGAADERVRIVGHPPLVRTPASIPEGVTFLPLVRVVAGTERVLGFGRALIVAQPLQPGDGSAPDPEDQIVARFQMTKLGSAVGFTAVTAISTTALGYLSAVPALRTAHAQFEEPVLAPVLTR